MIGRDIEAYAASFAARVLLVVALVALAVGMGIGYAAGEEIEYPIQTVASSEPDTDSAEAGVLFKRGGKRGQSPEERTEPYDPETAPQFEVIPPSTPGDSPPPAAAPEPQGAALTPEQKVALKGLFVQAITLVVGAMLGSGAASPFMKMILEKLLGALGGAAATPPGTTPARVRKRAAKTVAA